MTRVDLRGVVCPLTWVRTRIALERIGIGESVEVLLAAGEPLENVPRTAMEEGHQVVSREPWPEGGADAWRVVLVKGGPAAGTGLVP